MRNVKIDISYVPYLDYCLAFFCILFMLLICVKKVTYLQKSNAFFGLLYATIACLSKQFINVHVCYANHVLIIITLTYVVLYAYANNLLTVASLRLIRVREDLVPSIQTPMNWCSVLGVLIMLPIYFVVFKANFQNQTEVVWLLANQITHLLTVASCISISFAIVSKQNKLSATATLALCSVFNTIGITCFVLGLIGNLTYTTAFLLLPTVIVIYYFGRNAYNAKDGLYIIDTFSEATHELADKSYYFYVVVFSKDYLLENPEVIQIVTKANCKSFRKHFTFMYNGYMLVTLVPKKSNDFYRRMNAVLNILQHPLIAEDTEHKIIVSELMSKELSIDEVVDFTEFMARKFSRDERFLLCSKAYACEYRRYRTIVENLMDISYAKNPEDERVLVYLQPVLWAKEDKLLSAESLMRLKLPEFSVIEPNEFIPIAERIGCIHQLSLVMLHKVCIQINQMREKHLVFKYISVNFSLSELHQKNFLSDIEGILQKTGADPTFLAFEITETRSEHDHELVKQVMCDIKRLGIAMYLDDFGTGYSNFERIMSLPFDVIKFDKSLTDLSKVDSTSFYMISHFADIFAHSGFKILFEGVEDSADEMRCLNMSADYLQGYRYAKPAPIENVKYFFI